MDHKLPFLCAVLLFFSVVCSQSTRSTKNQSLRPHIIGGTTIGKEEFKDYKYMAFIVATTTELPAWACTGTTISTSWVLSAAHCVLVDDPDLVTVFPGFPYSTDFISKAAKLVYHPQYNGSLKENDAVLIQVKVTMVFSDILGGITINNQTAPYGTDCKVVGYGSKTGLELPEGYPLYTTVKTKETATCSGYLAGQICAEPTTPGNTVCTYDGGSPLVCGNELAGTAVTDDNCGQRNYDLYQEVSQLKSWIEETIAKDPVYISSTTSAITTSVPTTTSSSNTFKCHIGLLSIVTIVLKKTAL